MVQSFALPEVIDHENVQTILDQGLLMLSQMGSGDSLSVDCSKLTQFDSSALSLVMGLLRQAQPMSASIVLEKVPEKLRSLAQVYGVAELVVA